MKYSLYVYIFWEIRPRHRIKTMTCCFPKVTILDSLTQQTHQASLIHSYNLWLFYLKITTLKKSGKEDFCDNWGKRKFVTFVKFVTFNIDIVNVGNLLLERLLFKEFCFSNKISGLYQFSSSNRLHYMVIWPLWRLMSSSSLTSRHQMPWEITIISEILRNRVNCQELDFNFTYLLSVPSHLLHFQP